VGKNGPPKFEVHYILYPDFPYRGVPYPLKGATYFNTINILKLVIAIYELLGLMESEGDEK